MSHSLFAGGGCKYIGRITKCDSETQSKQMPLESGASRLAWSNALSVRCQSTGDQLCSLVHVRPPLGTTITWGALCLDLWVCISGWGKTGYWRQKCKLMSIRCILTGLLVSSYLWNTCSVPGPVLGSKYIAVREKKKKSFASINILLFFICIFSFLWPHPWPMEVPRPGVQSEP